MSTKRIQVQGVHHITLNGANRKTSIDFWEGVLGMPFIFEQPNLDNPDESHVYFDPGDGRLITVFTNESREADTSRTPNDPGCVHHLAFNVSKERESSDPSNIEDDVSISLSNDDFNSSLIVGNLYKCVPS